MVLRFNSYDKFVSTYYFAITPQEMELMFEDFAAQANIKCNFEDMISDQHSPFYDFLDQHIFNYEIQNLGIIPSIIKKIHYFNKYTTKRPVIGIIKFLGIPTTYELDVPEELEFSEIDDIFLENKFHETLLKRGLYYGKSLNEITDNCIIKYDLRHLSDGNVISIIPNQEFDMLIDREYDKSLFIGAKKDDIVVINNDEVIVDAVIKEIYEKCPYDEEHYDKKKISTFGYNTFKEFKKNYLEVAKNYLQINQVADNYCEFFQYLNQVLFPKDLSALYKETLNDDECEKGLLLDIIGRWIQNEFDSFPIQDSLMDAYHSIGIYEMVMNISDIQLCDLMKYINAVLINMYLKSKGVLIEN